MAMLLYHHPVSTCSQKVRLALAEKGMTFDQYIIDWTTMEHLEDWYLALNPNGVVPTLVHDGVSIVDSSVICEYLDEASPANPIAPRDPIGRAQMRAWMRYFEEVPTVAIRAPSFNRLFASAIRGGRDDEQYESMTARMPLRKHFYRRMGEDGFDAATVDESLDRLRTSLGRVARALADGRAYLLGDAYTIADIVFVPTVVRMSDLGLDQLWSDLPEVARWFEAVQQRPSFDMAYLPGSRVDPGDYSLAQGNRDDRR